MAVMGMLLCTCDLLFYGNSPCGKFEFTNSSRPLYSFQLGCSDSRPIPIFQSLVDGRYQFQYFVNMEGFVSDAFIPSKIN